MSIFIAVDLGGTYIRAAAYLQDQTLPLRHKKIRTRSKNETIFGRLLRVVRDVIPPNETVEAIGIAAPGPLNSREGVILNSPNLPEWGEFPLVSRLQAEFGCRVSLGNDADLAALGEWRYGAGRGYNDVLYLTLSTGVGGGVISGGSLVQGRDGLAAELGHVIVQAGGEICSCGKRGHLEAYASGTAIAKYVEEKLKDPLTESSLRSSAKRSAKEIAEAARRGDALALSAFQRAGKYLGVGVAGFLHIFNPSIVIFGGGVSASGDILFDPFYASLQTEIFSPPYLNNLLVTTAALGDNAGLLGALALLKTTKHYS